MIPACPFPFICCMVFTLNQSTHIGIGLKRSGKNPWSTLPMDGQSQATNRIIQIFERLEKEFEFSRSLSSMMIWLADMEDSSCRERHCSVFRISRRWHPYSFLRTMGRDSARLTLKYWTKINHQKIELIFWILCGRSFTHVMIFISVLNRNWIS